eukprot:8980753-Lingulodinium_polyedra.AAC.1
MPLAVNESVSACQPGGRLPRGRLIRHLSCNRGFQSAPPQLAVHLLIAAKPDHLGLSRKRETIRCTTLI